MNEVLKAVKSDPTIKVGVGFNVLNIALMIRTAKRGPISMPSLAALCVIEAFYLGYTSGRVHGALSD